MQRPLGGGTATAVSQFVSAVMLLRGPRRRVSPIATAKLSNELRSGAYPPLHRGHGHLRYGVGGGWHRCTSTHTAAGPRVSSVGGGGGFATVRTAKIPREPRPGRSWQRLRPARPPAPPAAAGKLGEGRTGAPDPRGNPTHRVNSLRSTVKNKSATVTISPSTATPDSGSPHGRATRMRPQPIASAGVGRLLNSGSLMPSASVKPSVRTARIEFMWPLARRRLRLPQRCLLTSAVNILLLRRHSTVEADVDASCSAWAWHGIYFLVATKAGISLGSLGSARHGSGSPTRVLRDSLGTPAGASIGAAVGDATGGTPIHDATAKTLHSAPGVGVAAP